MDYTSSSQDVFWKHFLDLRLLLPYTTEGLCKSSEFCDDQGKSISPNPYGMSASVQQTDTGSGATWLRLARDFAAAHAYLWEAPVPVPPGSSSAPRAVFLLDFQEKRQDNFQDADRGGSGDLGAVDRQPEGVECHDQADDKDVGARARFNAACEI